MSWSAGDEDRPELEMAREDLLAQTFVEITDVLVDNFDLVEVTQRMVDRCVDLFDAAAVGLLLADPAGKLRVAASSSHRLQMVELFEVQAAEGACVDCYRSGAPVVNQDLAWSTGRWPQFAPIALGAGFHSVHALPVRLRGHVIGALNLFRADTGTLTHADVLAAQALADVTAIAILKHRALQDAHLLAGQLQTALSSRVVIEQATGMVAQGSRISVEEAFERIRKHARNTNQQVSVVSQAVVANTLVLATPVRRQTSR